MSRLVHLCSTLLRHSPWALLALTVLHQIQWALAWDRVALSHRVVLLGALTMAADCWRRYGPARTLVAAAGTLLLTWSVELLGVSTGVPFGEYRYSTSVSYRLCAPGTDLCSDAMSATHTVPMVAGITAIVPAAWFMMAYATWRLGQRLGRNPRTAWAWSTCSLAAWDLILDPQFLLDPQLDGAGWWVWAHAEPHLPGIPGIPLTNYAGWLLTAAVVHIFLAFALGGDRRPTLDDERAPSRLEVATVFYVWTWFGGMFIGWRYLDSPAVAAWAGLAMGIPAGAYVYPVVRNLRDPLRSRLLAAGSRR